MREASPELPADPSSGGPSDDEAAETDQVAARAPSLSPGIMRAIREAARAGAGILEPVVPAGCRVAAPALVPGERPLVISRRNPEQRTALLAVEDRAVNGTALEPTAPAATERVRPERELFPHLLTPDAVPAPKTSNAPDDDIVRRRITIEQWWGQAFADAKLSVEQLLPYRVRLAWRVTRELASIRGIVTDYESLESATIDHVSGRDPWEEPAGLMWDKSMQGKHSYRWEVLHLLSRAKFTEGQRGDGRILALLPPAVHSSYLDESGHVVPDYDPEKDGALRRWLAAVDLVVKRFGMERGSARDRQQGFYGLRFVFEPKMTRLVWPSRWDIMACENDLVEEVLKDTISKGVGHARNELREKYGLTDREVQVLVNIARTVAQKRVAHDIEEQRAVMVMRLDSIIERAQNNLDVRAELLALKAQASVLGLNKGEPEDLAKDFVRAVEKVSRPQISAHATRSLPVHDEDDEERDDDE